LVSALLLADGGEEHINNLTRKIASRSPKEIKRCSVKWTENAKLSGGTVEELERHVNGTREVISSGSFLEE